VGAAIWFYRDRKSRLIDTAVAAVRQQQSAELPSIQPHSSYPVRRPVAELQAQSSIQPAQTFSVDAERFRFPTKATKSDLDANDPSAVMNEAMGGEHAQQTAAPSEVQTASLPASSTDAASVAWTVGPIALLVFVVVVILIVLAEQRPAPSTPAPAQDPWESLGRPVGAPSPCAVRIHNE
jgi:hypothetical protein